MRRVSLACKRACAAGTAIAWSVGSCLRFESRTHPCSLPRGPDQWFLTLCVCAPVDAQWPRDDDRERLLRHRCWPPALCRSAQGECSSSEQCHPLCELFFASRLTTAPACVASQSIRYCVQEVRTSCRLTPPCPVLFVPNPLTGSLLACRTDGQLRRPLRLPDLRQYAGLIQTSTLHAVVTTVPNHSRHTMLAFCLADYDFNYDRSKNLRPKRNIRT